jgi:uncharacterized membrane protein
VQIDIRTVSQEADTLPLSRIVQTVSLVLAFGTIATNAQAELKLCNASASRIGISIGYQDTTGWATEGWWNIASQTCETILKGNVPSRFIYVHAIDYDRGGEWTGTNVMCTDEKSFAVRGVQDCQKRGLKKSGFFEVDTGDAKEWTIRLTDPDDASGKAK